MAGGHHRPVSRQRRRRCRSAAGGCSWKRGSKTEKRFIRPEAERFVAEHAAELKLYTLSLWVVVGHYVPPPDTPGRRAERERLYIEAMQRDPKLD